MPLLSDALQPLQNQIREAAEQRSPLHIRGGGSKNFYGQPGHGAILDTRTLSGVIDYAPSELVITAAAGTPLREIEALLAAQGQCLAFEPPHFGWSADAATGSSSATVGGMVACGLAGPARASAGNVRDFVLGLKLVNGSGELLTFGGQVMKNVAGYDVSRLMAGAMGTLGLITEVSLKVLPVAPAEATLVFALSQAEALEHLHRWGGQPLPLNASCWVRDGEGSPGARDLLFVRLRGAKAAVEAACQRMLAEVPGERMDTAQAAADWTLCRDQKLPFFTAGIGSGLVLWRLSVAQTAPVLELPWPQLVEWHGGLRWLWAPLSAGPQLQAAAQAASGNATVFVADGADVAGASSRFSSYSATELAMHRRLKAAFDPAGIFNPQRLYPDF
ncbi:glycolate oxidase subunit GlcE [Rhodoferax sp. OV413]|uniref:glycolate oxidase subunit GlcE n=1 Tax=Rhodoferax sp. OV413 TaxID=1855285 RepID=UPI0025CCFE7B|nr:glycolate oxidase subunit GlcE [Rhodoferax sp. OV413]